MELKTIAARLRDITANDNDAGDRQTDRLLSRAARALEPLWPAIRERLEIDEPFPRPIAPVGTLDDEAVRLWVMAWRMITPLIAPRLDLHDAADNQARTMHTINDGTVKVRIAELNTVDWRARAVGAADLLDAVMSRLEVAKTTKKKPGSTKKRWTVKELDEHVELVLRDGDYESRRHYIVDSLRSISETIGCHRDTLSKTDFAEKQNEDLAQTWRREHGVTANKRGATRRYNKSVDKND